MERYNPVIMYDYVHSISEYILIKLNASGTLHILYKVP
jgi:hypothetical protein